MREEMERGRLLRTAGLDLPYFIEYKLEDQRSHDVTDEKKKEDCGRQIRSSKSEEERELWLRRLRDQTYVDLRH